MFKHALFGAVIGLMAATGSAQGLTVPQGLREGEGVTITYENPNRKGDTVTVVVRSDNPSEPPMELDIHLDEKGKGTTTWTVPGWMLVTFSAPEVEAIVRVIE